MNSLSQKQTVRGKRLWTLKRTIALKQFTYSTEIRNGSIDNAIAILDRIVVGNCLSSVLHDLIYDYISRFRAFPLAACISA